MGLSSVLLCCALCGAGVEGLQGSPDPCPGAASWNQFCFGWHLRANVWDSNTGAYDKWLWRLIDKQTHLVNEQKNKQNEYV